MISVVICAYTDDRWSLLQRAVASVEAQVPQPEIVVVIDHAEALYRRSLERWPHLAVVQNARARGLSGARNSGVEAARGDVIAFLDDDARALDSSWLSVLAGPFHDPAVGGVGGLVLPDLEVAAPRWFPREFLWVVGCSYVGQPQHAQQVRNPIGANMAFRRSVFEEAGGFHEAIGRVGALPLGCEETELSLRAAASGFTVWYEPEAVVEHSVPATRLTPAYFVRRCFAEGVSKAMVAALAGVGRSLSSETTYVSHVLTSGLWRAVIDVVRGPGRGAAAGRAGAIVAGFAAATVGYLYGCVRCRRSTAVHPLLAVGRP